MLHNLNHDEYISNPNVWDGPAPSDLFGKVSTEKILKKNKILVFFYFFHVSCINNFLAKILLR